MTHSPNHQLWAHQWDQDLPRFRTTPPDQCNPPCPDIYAHNKKVTPLIEAMAVDTTLPPARTREEAATLHALHTINTARQALNSAARLLLEKGALRDGADPTAVAAVLHTAARNIAQSPQWADRVRPPIGAHHNPQHGANLAAAHTAIHTQTSHPHAA